MRRLNAASVGGVGLCAAPLLLVMLAGCASDYGGAINGQRALSPEEQRLQAVETKLTEVSRRLNALDAAQQNGQSSDELRNLRGQVEQLTHDVAEAQQKAQTEYDELDQRLKRLEGGGATAAPGETLPGAAAPAVGGAAVAPAAANPAASSPAAAGASGPPSSAAADEEAAYLRSFDLLKAGKYDDAIRGFQGMVNKYPQGNYADNAWYWMGESYYVKRDFPKALNSYQSLLRNFPASPKVPDALLKTGTIYQEQQQKDQARAAFNKVLKSYPTSSAAAQARTRLAQLK